MFGSDDSDDSEGGDSDGGVISPTRIAQVAATAKVAGKQAAMPVIKRVLREQIVSMLRSNEPEKLRELIDVQYPMVEEELPEGYKTALSNAGPTFEDEIKHMLSPARVKGWFVKPESWMDPEENPDAFYDVEEIGHILETHPDADEWLARQILAVYRICGIA